MSTVIQRLSQSNDELERDLAKCLLKWQEAKRAMGRSPRLGYEPRDINKHGAIEVISRRVLACSSGFEEVGVQYSYEAIVSRYPVRFSENVVDKAMYRLAEEKWFFGPTGSAEQYAERVATLLKRPLAESVEGTVSPEKRNQSVGRYLRDPKVGAFVLFRADGHCELCLKPAPFERQNGQAFLEVHHVKHLADGGSDRITNTVAVCPNCHRALHYANNANVLKEKLYEQIAGLMAE